MRQLSRYVGDKGLGYLLISAAYVLISGNQAIPGGTNAGFVVRMSAANDNQALVMLQPL